MLLYIYIHFVLMHFVYYYAYLFHIVGHHVQELIASIMETQWDPLDDRQSLNLGTVTIPKCFKIKLNSTEKVNFFIPNQQD